MAVLYGHWFSFFSSHTVVSSSLLLTGILPQMVVSAPLSLSASDPCLLAYDFHKRQIFPACAHPTCTKPAIQHIVLFHLFQEWSNVDA